MKSVIRLAIVMFIVVICLPLKAQVPQQAQQVFDLKVEIKDVELIGKGLGMLPYNDVSLLMQKLQIQINAQQQAAQKPEPKPEPKKEGPAKK